MLMHAYYRQFLSYLSDERGIREFAKFEDSLIDRTEIKNKYLTGESKLKNDVSVLIPRHSVATDTIESLFVSIQAEIELKELGTITRTFVSGEFWGIDIALDDFVAGIEELRRQLLDWQVPQGTTIEYSHGELPVYDMS